MGDFTARDLIGVAGVPAIVGLVELAKRVFPDLSPRLYPVLALVYGIGINLALLAYSGAGPVEAVAVGIVAALMASGLYSQARVAL
jgi:hypothetical protein